MLIKAEGITMDFGGFKAVSDASLSVERGEIVGSGFLIQQHAHVFLGAVKLLHAFVDDHALQ